MSTEKETKSPTITEAEVNAYKRFSKECARVEKSFYGKTAFQDPKLKAALGKDTKIDWAQAFEWTLSIKNMFDREGTEAFLTKVAPDLVTKLLAIETKTNTFLTLARALLNGLGWGTTPVPLGAGGPAPPNDPMHMPSTATVSARLSVVPPSSEPTAPSTAPSTASPLSEPLSAHHGRK